MFLVFLISQIFTRSPFALEEPSWNINLQYSGGADTYDNVSSSERLEVTVYREPLPGVTIEELHKLIVPLAVGHFAGSVGPSNFGAITNVTIHPKTATISRSYARDASGSSIGLGATVFATKDEARTHLDADYNPPPGQSIYRKYQFVLKDERFPYRLGLGDYGWVVAGGSKPPLEHEKVGVRSLEFRRGRALVQVFGERAEPYARAMDYRILQDANISLDRRAVRTVTVNGKPIRVTMQNGLEMVLGRDLKPLGVKERYQTVNGVGEAVLSFGSATKTVIPYQARPATDNGSGEIPSWTYQGDVVIPLRSTLAALKVPTK